MQGKKLLIIDANAIVHRAFHALPPLKTKSGEIVDKESLTGKMIGVK